MLSEKLTRIPLRQWLLVALTVGLALIVALSMTFADDAEARKKKKKKKKIVYIPETRTFSNTGAISYLGPATGTAIPYPSDIAASFKPGSKIIDVNLKLNAYSGVPDDTAVMVAHGQTNQGVMADAGGAVAISVLTPITFTLDDEAPTALPDATPLTDNTSYKPARYGADWPAPAPSALSVFDGEDPNGTWSLFVVDDGFGATPGSFAGGWNLVITANVPHRK